MRSNKRRNLRLLRYQRYSERLCLLKYSESQIYEYIASVFYNVVLHISDQNPRKMSLILIYQLHSYFRAINLPWIKNKKSFFRIIKKLMTVYVFIYLGFTVWFYVHVNNFKNWLFSLVISLQKLLFSLKPRKVRIYII